MKNKNHLTLEHKLLPEVELTYSTVLDLRKFGQFHPYMKEIVLRGEKESENKIYSISEEVFLFGFIKTNPQYDAQVIEIEIGKHIRYLSQVKKNVQLQIDFYFETSKKNQLMVREEISLNANYVIAFVFLRLLKKTHLQVFENLRKVLRNSVEDL